MATAEEMTSAASGATAGQASSDQHEHAVVDGGRRPRHAGVAQELGNARTCLDCERERAVHEPASNHGKGNSGDAGNDRVDCRARASAPQHQRVDGERHAARYEERQPVTERMLAARRSPVLLPGHRSVLQPRPGERAARRRLRDGRQMREGRLTSRMSASYSMRRRVDHGIEAGKLGVGMAGVAHDEVPRGPARATRRCSSSA